MQVLLENETYSVTSKGQVTLPLYLRKRLGIKVGDQVSFKIEKNMLRVVPVKDSLKAVFGSVKPLKKKISLDKMKKIALEGKFNAIR